MTRTVVACGFLLMTLASTPGCRTDIGQQEAKTRARIEHVCQAIEMFQVDHGRYPMALQDLWKQPDTISADKWPARGYLRRAKDVKDAWGRELIYREPGSEGFAYDVISLGERPRSGETIIRNRPAPK